MYADSLIDFGHLDRFRLGITLPANQRIGHDDHLGNVPLSHVGGNGIGQRPEMFLTNSPTAEFANALCRAATYTAFHDGASLNWVSAARLSE
jgi:hypothetical protein